MTEQHHSGGTDTDLVQAYEAHLRSAASKLLPTGPAEALPLPTDDRAAAKIRIMRYLTGLDAYVRRRVSPHPRAVHTSVAFEQNPKRSEYGERIDELFRLFRVGAPTINDPAAGFLSQRAEWVFNRQEDLGRRLFLDKLLREWGIHHFHLGHPRRTDDLLFAFVRHGDVYVVDVGSHFSEADVSLYSQQLLDIAQSEWPFLLPRLQGCSGDRLTPDQVRTLRRSNAGHVPRVGDVAVAPLDLVTAGGIPIRLVRLADMMVATLEILERQLEAAETRQQIASGVGTTCDELDLRWIAHEGNFQGCVFLQDRATGKGVRVTMDLDGCPPWLQHAVAASTAILSAAIAA